MPLSGPGRTEPAEVRLEPQGQNLVDPTSLLHNSSTVEYPLFEDGD